MVVKLFWRGKEYEINVDKIAYSEIPEVACSFLKYICIDNCDDFEFISVHVGSISRQFAASMLKRWIGAAGRLKSDLTKYYYIRPNNNTYNDEIEEEIEEEKLDESVNGILSSFDNL